MAKCIRTRSCYEYSVVFIILFPTPRLRYQQVKAVGPESEMVGWAWMLKEKQRKGKTVEIRATFMFEAHTLAFNFLQHCGVKWKCFLSEWFYRGEIQLNLKSKWGYDLKIRWDFCHPICSENFSYPGILIQ